MSTATMPRVNAIGDLSIDTPDTETMDFMFRTVRNMMMNNETGFIIQKSGNLLIEVLKQVGYDFTNEGDQ